MTHSEVLKKIESISYYHNRYIHNGALNLCDGIVKGKHFSEEIKKKVLIIKIQLKELKEPWGETTTSPDNYMLKNVQDCLNSIYNLIE